MAYEGKTIRIETGEKEARGFVEQNIGTLFEYLAEQYSYVLSGFLQDYESDFVKFVMKEGHTDE